MIKVFVVEDQAMVRGALVALLQMEDNIQVVGEANNGLNALKKIESLELDILLTDIEMPDMTGIELAEKCLSEGCTFKVVVVTTFGRSGYVKRALEAGVQGFLLKDAPSSDLSRSLRKVYSGEKVVDPQLAISAIQNIDPLNEKERKALRLAFEGKSTTEIAGLLFLSEGTVRNYLSEAISKLNARNRIDAARIAHQAGWL